MLCGGRGDQLTAVGSTTISYDEIGNPTTFKEYELSWHGRQLKEMEKTNSVIQFLYNADGIRTNKIVNGTDHIYTLNGSQIVSEAWGDNLLVYLYDESGSSIGMQYRNTGYTANSFTTFYFEKNLQGDIVALYDANGAKVLSYNYDAWGNHTTTWHNSYGVNMYAIYNPFRYRGYYYDTETGLYYLQSRYYNPQWGRFLNSDNVIAGISGSLQGYNTYAYCFNNPVNMTDVAGSWPSRDDIEAEFKKAISWLDENIIQPINNFVADVEEDFNNYNPNNHSEDVVFSSNVFSNYKGALVVKTPFDASFSFGFIGLSTRQQDTNILKHEYGHTIQMKNMGLCKYIANVAVPSITINLLDRQDKLPYDYYTYPWEAEANQLDDANLSQSGKSPLPADGYNSYRDLIKLFYE